MGNEKDLRLALDIATATGGAIIAAVMPALAIPVATVTVGANAAGHSFIDRHLARSRAAVQETIEAAVVTAGITAEQLIAKIAADERLLLVFSDVVDSSIRSALHEKIRAMGRSLGKMAVDEALIDPESVWIGIYKVIERPHVRVLQILFSERAKAFQSVYPDLYDAERLGSLTGLGVAVQPILSTLTDIGALELYSAQRSTSAMPEHYREGKLARVLLSNLEGLSHTT
ncbi:hypothetical protein [Subtercola sp. RTI3]|uniref:hypothetical protein n=1 Tax=Subtercola sp. RTI3 TaxID=3048639 RepID=UPI002B23AF2F|nr:hypothetical protein [Subtercola sp. RTI3]MEA9983662.1 hypothetical protein [Subtercola sp. RTI3]